MGAGRASVHNCASTLVIGAKVVKGSEHALDNFFTHAAAALVALHNALPSS